MLNGLFERAFQVGIIFLLTPYIEKELAPLQAQINQIAGVKQ